MRVSILFKLLFLLIFKISVAQEINFIQTLKVSKNQKYFEQVMYSEGNDLIDIYISDTCYSYITSSGGIGACRQIPTKDKRMEKKYIFTDGEIISETDLDRKYDTDERNNMFSEGKISELEGQQDKYNYVADLLNYSSYITTKSKFGRNYNNIEETAITFYTHTQTKYIKNKGKGPVSYTNILEIQYNNDEHYKSMLKQIQKYCVYIKTSKLLDYLYVNYTYKDASINKYCNITCTPSSDHSGGSISFTWYDLN